MRAPFVATALVVVGVLVAVAWLATPRRSFRVLAQHGPYAMRLERTPRFVRTGVPTTLRITVTRQGQPARLAEDGQVLHAILVSADRTDLQHVLGPPEEAPGVYALTHAFPRPGRYGLWAEITSADDAHHGSGATLLAVTTLAAWGPGQPVASPPSTERSTKLHDGTTIRWAADVSPLRTGLPVRLTLSATDRNGQAVPVFPDRSANMMVIVGPNLDLLRHGHADAVDASGAVVETIFPSPGTYALWTRILLEGQDALRPADARFLVQVR